MTPTQDQREKALETLDRMVKNFVTRLGGDIESAISVINDGDVIKSALTTPPSVPQEVVEALKNKMNSFRYHYELDAGLSEEKLAYRRGIYDTCKKILAILKQGENDGR